MEPVSKISQSRSRFKDLEWFSEIEKVNEGGQIVYVVGAGGIGSWVSFFLARAGVLHELYDHDTIEEHNLGGQLYMMGQMGMNKCEAMHYINSAFSNFHTGFLVGEFNDQYSASSIMFSCVDSLHARKLLFRKWLEAIATDDEGSVSEGIFIDGRILAEDGQIFTIRARDEAAIKEYQSKYLFSDSEAPPIICTAKATSHCGALIGSLMVGTFFNYLTNLKKGGPIREVPFKNEFHLQLMQFNQYDANTTRTESAAGTSDTSLVTTHDSLVTEGEGIVPLQEEQPSGIPSLSTFLSTI